MTLQRMGVTKDQYQRPQKTLNHRN